METHTITIENNTFNPSQITIKTNDQVQWSNEDTVEHQIKGEGWGDIPIKSGEKYTQAFIKPGTYPYSCTIHPEMTGTIIVE